MRELAWRGTISACDGRQQNEGPTPYLLVIDPKARTVHGFDRHRGEP